MAEPRDRLLNLRNPETPRKPPERRRDRRVSAWLTPGLEARLQARAEAEGCSVSSYLARLVSREVDAAA